MKKIFGLALVLFVTLGVFAQERTIEKTEFDVIYQDSFRIWAGKSYRTITTSEQCVLGKPQLGSSFKSITEFQPTVGHRSTFESYPLRLGDSKKEVIVVDNKIYTRKGNEKWILEKYDSKPYESLINTVNNKVEYKYLGIEKLNNQNTKIYAKIERKRLFHQTTDSESLSITTTKYWFSESGELLKSESAAETNFGTWATNHKSITVYELDPNIRIEAPKLN